MRRKTAIGGRVRPDDWDILYNRSSVGRVYSIFTPGGGSEWAWCTWTYPTTNGRASTLEEALTEVKEAIMSLEPSNRVNWTERRGSRPRMEKRTKSGA